MPETPAIRAKGNISSIEYSRQGGNGGTTFTPWETCDPLCMALMRGGQLDWLRLERFDTVEQGQSLFPADGQSCADLGAKPSGRHCLRPPRIARMTTLIVRVDPAQCRAEAADFPTDAPCLRFQPDDGRKADLRLALIAAEPQQLRAASTPRVTALAQHGLSVTDMLAATPLVLAQKASLSFSTPQPVPFYYPKARITGGGGGLQRWAKRHYQPAPDPALPLAEIGLRLAPVRQDEPFVVAPELVVDFSPTIRALADSWPQEALAVWTRHDPPPVAIPIGPKQPSKAEIQTQRAAGLAAERELWMRAIMRGARSAPP